MSSGVEACGRKRVGIASYYFLVERLGFDSLLLLEPDFGPTTIVGTVSFESAQGIFLTEYSRHFYSPPPTSLPPILFPLRIP